MSHVQENNNFPSECHTGTSHAKSQLVNVRTQQYIYIVFIIVILHKNMSETETVRHICPTYLIFLFLVVLLPQCANGYPVERMRLQQVKATQAEELDRPIGDYRV